ncbi:uncharacterized protein LOC142974910 [Anticarsia gemmatalis]|uniref:uncharacterized protein LOC142974910 n=1 Tax=Anticarsia gemmatalis TaxID=129554 RepID=UPI003F772AE5
MFILYICLLINSCYSNDSEDEIVGEATRTIDELIKQYEDDKNSMIAIPDMKDDVHLYDDFYDEFDNRPRVEQSMNMIFFGPTSSFLRIDPESLLHILTSTKNHLVPMSRALLAWDMLTDGKTAAFLQGREYLALGTLLNVVPEEDLYYVNFGDPSVLKYFSHYYANLLPRKYGVLAASYRRYYGELWYQNSTSINEMGYLLCGFPATAFAKISPSTFKEISPITLKRAGKCSINQTRTLYNIAKHRDAYGEPYKWSSHEVNRLSMIFARIPANDIGSVGLDAITAISSDVMHAMPQDKLLHFTKAQILSMNPKTRRLYLIRMQLRTSYDTNELSRRQRGVVASPSVFWISLLIVTLLVFNL